MREVTTDGSLSLSYLMTNCMSALLAAYYIGRGTYPKAMSVVEALLSFAASLAFALVLVKLSRLLLIIKILFLANSVKLRILI